MSFLHKVATVLSCGKLSESPSKSNSSHNSDIYSNSFGPYNPEPSTNYEKTKVSDMHSVCLSMVSLADSRRLDGGHILVGDCLVLSDLSEGHSVKQSIYAPIRMLDVERTTE